MRVHRNLQQGISTLLITAVLALLMALYVFGVLAVETFNAKKTQNAVVTKELKTRADAELQCAKEIVLSSGDLAAAHDFSSCSKAKIELEQIDVNNYELRSIVADLVSEGQAVSKVILSNYGLSGPTAAISSTGNLVFNVSQTIDPYEGDKVGTGYNCSAIRTGGTFTLQDNADLVVRHPLDQNGQPKKGEDGNVIKCNSSHLTQSPKSRADYKLDIAENVKDMDLFEENFGIPREEWAKAKEKFQEFLTPTMVTQDIVVGHGTDGTPITKSVTFPKVVDCGKKIQAIIDANKALKPGEEKKKIEYIWVEGSCDLSGMKYEQTAPDTAGVTVVVKDGFIHTSVPTSFHGNLYMLDVAMTNEQLKAAWANSKLDVYMAGRNVDLANVPFYFHGTFQTQGAFNLDSPNRDSHVFGAFQPGYSKGKAMPGTPLFPQVKILNGSWHDF